MSVVADTRDRTPLSVWWIRKNNPGLPMRSAFPFTLQVTPGFGVPARRPHPTTEGRKAGPGRQRVRLP